MKHILIANAKGGSGKSTVATNLAGYFAKGNNKVALHDLDRQQSSKQWLKNRPDYLPRIYGEDYKTDKLDWLITDTPAGFKGDKLEKAVKKADCILVPIQPSPFDIGATEAFINVLQAEKAVRKNKTFVGLVGLRVGSRTNAAKTLTEFMEAQDFPIVSYLRNTQNYVNAAGRGFSVFDMRPSFVTKDLAQWAPIIEWIKKATR